MAIRKKFKARKLMVPMVTASFFLVAGAVYAAATGAFTLSGSVGRNANCRLNIEAATNVDPSSTNIFQTDSTITAAVDAATRNTLSFATDLTYGATAKQVQFQIQNVGNCTQVLGSMVVVDAPSNGVVVGWPSINGLVLGPGQSSGPLEITVQWTTEPTATTSEIMSATITYSEQ
ncbi:hypothetical protein FWG76_02830 [Candidatus Saccharibacteria bacterium]|nr:hypothetical protein [Candidatus Saccharibacteria bacterium]